MIASPENKKQGGAKNLGHSLKDHKKRCEDRMEAARVMVRETKEFGFFEEYYPEMESSFTISWKGLCRIHKLCND